MTMAFLRLRLRMGYSLTMEDIYFFHIPKTSGMSVWIFLTQAFPSHKVCPWWLWEQLIALPRTELDQWNLFRGHFLSHLEPYLGKRLVTFTMLRDPVERTLSHFYHVRRAVEHPFHEQALGMSLAEFCVHPTTRHMVENYQASYLAKAPRDPIEAAQGLTPEGLARFQLQERLQYPDTFADGAALLESAKARLATFAAVGFTEDFTNSLQRISHALNGLASQPFEPENVNLHRAPTTTVDETTLSVIRALTEVDRELYQWARDQQSRKMVA